MPDVNVLVSNGFGKFHLTIAAAEVAKSGALARLLTGFYPIGLFAKIPEMPLLRRVTRLRRLLARGERISPELVSSLWVSELIFYAGSFLGGLDRETGLGRFLINYSHRHYARRAAKCVKRATNITVFHYRSGYGLAALTEAKRHQMLLLCDHSIAHPAVLESLVERNGRMPEPNEVTKVSAFWRSVLCDVNEADHVLVNSEFVRETFLHQGWDPTRVHVIYLGVDDAFLKSIPKEPEKPAQSDHSGPLRMAFAGHLSVRKGASVLIDALGKISDVDWEIEFIGPVDQQILASHPAFFADPRVKLVGNLARAELARRLAITPVFVFPTLAEGSARVVFEALACGCYVITTPNAGSIVEDRVHGALVPPGDSAALAMAIKQAAEQRQLLPRIGQANAELIKHSHRQTQAGQQLLALYEKLLASQGPQRVYAADQEGSTPS